MYATCDGKTLDIQFAGGVFVPMIGDIIQTNDGKAYRVVSRVFMQEHLSSSVRPHSVKVIEVTQSIHAMSAGQ